MRKSRFTDSQIMAFLKQNEEGAKVPDLCREHGFSAAQFYKWRSKFGGMDASMMKRMKELEDENRRLKKCTPKRNSKLIFVRRFCKKSGEAVSKERDGAMASYPARHKCSFGL